MKILHINQSDIVGGASILAYRLHQALANKGFDSFILADVVKSLDPTIFPIKRRRLLEELSSRFFQQLGLNYVDIKNTFSLPDYPCFQESDILNFHNLHGGYFNYLAISKLTQRKPAVFTLHDMWSFTGHCAYSFGCDRWKTGCGQCPHLDTYPVVSRDRTSLEWKLKRWIYNHSNLRIVTPSKWLFELAQQSLLSHLPISHIPNGLDVSVYCPLEPQMCRAALRLPLDKKVVFFITQSLKDPRKGGDLLFESLRNLPQSLKKEIVLVTMGQAGETLAEAIDVQTVTLGYVGSDRLKALAYSAADLFIFPTRADNFPIVLQESMACGTPMVSFDVGGVSELVRPGITGLLAKPEDPADLANKIAELLEDDSLRYKMSENCRSIAVEEYSIELQAQRYIALYKKAVVSFDR